MRQFVVARSALRAGADVRALLLSEGAPRWRVELRIGHSIIRDMLSAKLHQLPLVDHGR